MSFQLPDSYLRTDLAWGPPAEEMTLDGWPFELYFKSDEVQAFEWMRIFNDDNREEDEDEKYENRGAYKEAEFKEVRDEVRLNALRAESARQDKLRGIIHKGGAANKQANQRQRQNNQYNKGKGPYKRRQVVEIKTGVRLEPQYYATFTQRDLAKSTVDRRPVVADLAVYGKPLIYNASQDAAAPTKPVQLGDGKINASKLSECARPTTMDDRRLREFVMKESGKYPCVVMTDEVMAVLMASSASVYPWHVQIKKMPNRPIYFIGKEDGTDVIDMQWVSETTPLDVRPSEADPMVSERVSSLGQESTLVQERFIRSSCTTRLADIRVDKGYPFPGTLPRMYRYRRFTMHPDSPNQYDIIVRTEIDAVTPEKEALRLFGLLEHRPQTGPNANVTDPKKLESDWVANMGKNTATYTPVEFRKNQFKMSRWIALSAISGAQYMKIGFITRADGSAEVGTRHNILNILTDRPETLASQLGVTVPSMWGTLDLLLETMLNTKDLSDAVFAKLPGEYSVVLGQMQADSTDEDDDDDEDEDDDDEEDESDDE